MPLLGLLIAALLVQSAPAQDLPPLHQRIDQLVRATQGEMADTLAAPASDTEFVRRLYLDLTGRIPTHPAVQEFLNNPADNRREQLVDQLLSTPQHALRLQHTFDVMLMQRLPKKHVEPTAWQDYLFSSFLQNKSWKQLASELLSAATKRYGTSAVSSLAAICNVHNVMIIPRSATILSSITMA